MASAPAPRRPASAHAAHVLGETLFRAAVLRERKRADRALAGCAVLLVRVPRAWRDGDSVVGTAVVDSIVATRREIDLVGWARRDVLALLMPGTTWTVAAGVKARLHHEMVLRLGRPLPVALRVYRDRRPTAARPGEADGVDAWLDAREGRRRRRPVARDLAKRTLDVVTSATLLIVLAPVLLLVAAVVKLTSRGSVLYRQVRVGWRQEPFEMLKFRTMRPDADARIHHEYVTRFITRAAPASGHGTAAVFKLTDDPRITRAGRFLRRTSLDELPQLWNVLRGDMSLVGPRPPLPYELEHYQPWHRRRILEAKPGLTGLWQVTGRSRTTFDDMVRLDLRYARTRSLWLDVTILLRTPAAVISGKGAC